MIPTRSALPAPSKEGAFLFCASHFAVDLCCGAGGWTRGLQAAGLSVIGFDVRRFKDYPGHLVLQDIRTLDGRQFKNAKVIVASPPCEEFTRHDLPWTRKRNPPPPDLSLAQAVLRIREESGVPVVMENVRGSRKWLEPMWGPARPCGSFYLYGDVPILLPKFYRAPHGGVDDQELASKLKVRFSPKGKSSLRPGEVPSKEYMAHLPHHRAFVPFELSAWIGEVYAR